MSIPILSHLLGSEEAADDHSIAFIAVLLTRHLHTKYKDTIDQDNEIKVLLMSLVRYACKKCLGEDYQEIAEKTKKHPLDRLMDKLDKLANEFKENEDNFTTSEEAEA